MSLTSSVNQNPTPLISVSHCLGIHVAQPMKEKIWAKDYIDLSKLIQPDPDTDKTDQHKFSILDGQLVMSPKTNPKKITSLEAWTDAFIVFASIYLTRHPTDIQGILKYMQTIRLGTSRNPNASWLEYDKQFRLKMSADSTISWASVDAELWLIYMSNQPLTQQNQSNLKCYDYNFKGSCSRQHCPYLHSCMYSHKNHPRIHCWSLQSSQSVNTRHNPSQPIQSNNAPFVPACTITPSAHANHFKPQAHANHFNIQHKDLWGLGTSPVKINILQDYLARYPDRDTACSF